jgi:hypothetical protein
MSSTAESSSCKPRFEAHVVVTLQSLVDICTAEEPAASEGKSQWYGEGRRNQKIWVEASSAKGNVK